MVRYFSFSFERTPRVNFILIVLSLQALATILATYAQRHGGPSQLPAERLVALLTSPSNGTSGTLALYSAFFFGVASPHSNQPVDGGVSTSVAAALQPGPQGEGKIVGNVASFSNLPPTGVIHILRTGIAYGQQVETPEIQSSGQFFFSCPTEMPNHRHGSFSRINDSSGSRYFGFATSCYLSH